MLNQAICDYAKERGFSRQTLERWLKLTEADRQAFLDLVHELKLGENHLRDFLDWLEEIALRDGVSFREIFAGEALRKISSNPRLGRNDKLKQIKEELRRLRFPRLARTEEEIGKRLREMKFSPQIQITVPPGLEGGRLTVQMKASSYEQLERLVGELAQSLEKKTMKEIFALLGGLEEV